MVKRESDIATPNSIKSFSDSVRNKMSEYDYINYWLDTIKKITESMKLPRRAIQNINKKLPNFSNNFSEILKKLPKELHEIQIYLIDKGWYLSGDISINISRKIINLIENKKDNEIEIFMQNFTKSKTTIVERKLIKYWPKRARIIRESFCAHQKELYSLSIPVFLIQADGICYDILGVLLYSKDKKGIPKTNEKLNEEIDKAKVGDTKLKFDPLLDIFLNFLRFPTSINKTVVFNEYENKQKNNSAFGLFNRHLILHGKDTSYPTQANSLRAISILDYLIFLKETLENHIKIATEFRGTLDNKNVQ